MFTFLVVEDAENLLFSYLISKSLGVRRRDSWSCKLQCRYCNLIHLLQRDLIFIKKLEPDVPNIIEITQNLLLLKR